MLALDEIAGFWEQKNISAKNISRLKELAGFEDEEVRRKASLLLRVTQIAPRRKRRIPTIRQQDPELYRLLASEGYLEERLDWEDEQDLWDLVPDIYPRENPF